MKPTLFTYLSIAIAVALATEVSSVPPVFSQEPLSTLSTCVEAPATAVDASRKRNGKSTDCDADARRSEAIQQARANAANALSPTCTARISAQERQAICAASGLVPRPINATGDMRDFQQISGNPDGNIDTALPISGTLCVVVRDLPEEYTSQSLSAQWGGLGDCIVFHFPFVTSKTSVRFTARSRARCGVQCM